jgi:hypothetical protein
MGAVVTKGGEVDSDQRKPKRAARKASQGRRVEASLNALPSSLGSARASRMFMTRGPPTAEQRVRQLGADDRQLDR